MMRVMGMGGMDMLLVVFNWVIALAIVGGFLYFVIRRAVCAGMLDYEKKRAQCSREE